MSTKRFYLQTEALRQAAGLEVLHSEFGSHVQIRPDSRAEQRKTETYGLLAAISKHVEWYGAKRSVSEWRAVLIAMWIEPQMLEIGTGRDEPLESIQYWPPLDDLKAAEYDEWLDYVAGFAREHGVPEKPTVL